MRKRWSLLFTLFAGLWSVTRLVMRWSVARHRQLKPVKFKVKIK